MLAMEKYFPPEATDGFADMQLPVSNRAVSWVVPYEDVVLNLTLETRESNSLIKMNFHSPTKGKDEAKRALEGKTLGYLEFADRILSEAFDLEEAET